jgi:hypothetical protein
MIDCALEMGGHLARKTFLIKVKGLATQTIDENRTIDGVARAACEEISQAVFCYQHAVKSL